MVLSFISADALLPILKSRSLSRRNYVPRFRASASETYDVVIVGAGLGGLSAAAVLSAAYGVSVCVCEAHSIPGGAAHSFTRKTNRGTFIFDSGPSLFSGMKYDKSPSSNPLAHVLKAAGIDLEVMSYDTWGCFFENHYYTTKLNRKTPLFSSLMREASGPRAVSEIAALIEGMRPLSRAATALPPAALRAGDALGSLRMLARYFDVQMLKSVPAFPLLSQPFDPLLRRYVKDEFAYNFIDMLCFLLAGVPATDIVAAEVCFMFSEWTGSTAGSENADAILEFPKGGSGAIVDALVEAIDSSSTKSRVRLNSRVAEIIVRGDAVQGVRLVDGTVLRAREKVMSNATIWDTVKLLPSAYKTPSSPLMKTAKKLRPLDSFVHLHLGVDMTGLSMDGLELNYVFVNNWARGITDPGNVSVLCIPSVADPSLAPPGHIVLHAYTPATEPYSLYEGLDRKSEQYKMLKAERCEVLWRAVERVIPDVKKRAHVKMEGSPLTHERFLNVARGSYGPQISARDGLFPMPTVEGIDGLLCIGQSTFPGIGVPAVAASGLIAANSLVTLEKHAEMLERIGL